MIKIVCGAVKAGKSKKLIEYYNQLKDCGAYVFSSKFSLTQGEDIVSRYGTSMKAIPINSLFDIPHHIVNKPVYHILVDEFQFLQMSTQELKAFFDEYYYKYDFYLFGLSKDFRGYPFKLMANAIVMADDVSFLHGYCDICGKTPSCHSLRLENGKPADIRNDSKQIILLDGEYEDINISYKSICRDCYNDIYFKK